jgi:hypothetical protein
MQNAKDFRGTPQPGVEAQRRWFATAGLLVALVVLSILAPKLAGS